MYLLGAVRYHIWLRFIEGVLYFIAMLSSNVAMSRYVMQEKWLVKPGDNNNSYKLTVLFVQAVKFHFVGFVLRLFLQPTCPKMYIHICDTLNKEWIPMLRVKDKRTPTRSLQRHQAPELHVLRYICLNSIIANFEMASGEAGSHSEATTVVNVEIS